VLQIDLIRDEAGFLALEHDWRALVDGSRVLTPFQTWEWVEAWWRHHGYGTPFVLVARDAGVVVGILPLVLGRYRGTPLRQLRWMGAPLSDFQDFLAVDERRGEVAEALFTALGQEQARWDFADLNDLRADSTLPRLGLPAALRGTVNFHRKCPTITLEATWDVYAKSLGKNMRANVGRRRRQIEKQFATKLETVSDPAALPAAMTDLFALHNARWQRRGAKGAFATPELQAFHQEVARRFLERGWLRLHVMRCDGATKAAFYCFAFAGRVYYYLSGFDESIGKFSPGNVMMGFSLAEAMKEGAREFDLLRGDETYKYDWKATDRDTERLVIGHGGLRSHLGTLGHRFERFVEVQGIKVQRRLWGRKKQPVKTEAAASVEGHASA